MTFDPFTATPAAIATLKQCTDTLEQTVSNLMRTKPPPDATMMHLMVLPKTMEVIGAAREVLHAVGKQQTEETQAALNWLDDAIRQTRAALSAAAKPLPKS